jgi:hypothetical protein
VTARVDIDFTALRSGIESMAQGELDRVVTVLAKNADDNTPPRSADREKVTTKTGKRVYPKGMKGGFTWQRIGVATRRLSHRSRLFGKLEFGTSTMSPYAPIRRGVKDGGLEIRMDPKP